MSQQMNKFTDFREERVVKWSECLAIIARSFSARFSVFSTEIIVVQSETDACLSVATWQQQRLMEKTELLCWESVFVWSKGVDWIWQGVSYLSECCQLQLAWLVHSMKNYYDSVRYDINAHEKVSAANNEGWRQFFRELFHRFPEARVTSLSGEKK